ncbi:MAG: ABC transporter ATP-binding protein [Phycisphaerales bacterium]
MARAPLSSKQRFQDFLRERAKASATPASTADKPGAKGESPGKPARPRDWTLETPADGKRRANRSIPQLARAFRDLLRGHERQVVAALLTLTLNTLIGLVLPLSTKVAFDYIILDTPGPAGLPEWLPSDRLELLLLLGAAMVLVAGVGLVVQLSGRWQMTRLTKLTQTEMRRRVFDHLAQLPLHRLHALKSGGVSSIVRDDAGVIGEMLFSVLYNPLRAVITFVGGLAAMALLDWRMLIAGLLAGPAVYLSHRTWIARIRPVFRSIKQTRTAGDAHATEAFSGIRVVRAFGRRRGETGRYTRNAHLIARKEMLAWWWSRLLEGVWTLLIPVASAGVLVYGGWQVTRGALTIGDVVAFTTYLLMLLGPLEVLVSTASELQNSLAGFDRCLDVLEEPVEFAGAAGAQDTGRTPGVPLAPTMALRLEDVWFAYPNHDEFVLREIDLDVQPGETIALVGPSGSGKTTLCNLVARFFDPTRGRILLGGVDLREIPIDDYRALLGIVEQDVFLFDGSVADNIGYARRGATSEQISAAARAANAHEFIERFEAKYDTIIGERGVRLSGGQKQRIAIARAILADPRILILDEATSNLDSESEALIQRSLHELMRGRTCFVIAHRLGTIRHADRIVVLDRGTIVESGPHDQLYARQGRYFEMLQVQLHQNKDYAEAVQPK